ncbi:HAMP domain-containing histidine kinase [Croceibacterium xixiisoli]|nr:HAMP domain-containing histidine kinase [Croceibacterium xixiisoli]
MLFDDRLATVLRSRAGSDTAARTQYRQLIDLLGTLPVDADVDLGQEGLNRLGELSDALPFLWQAAILRQPGVRLRNPALVNWLADREPQVAAAAMSAASLAGDDWLEIIPHLPVSARGFLRHRADLPASARQMLERLGVGDLVLTDAAPRQAAPEVSPAQEPLEPTTPAPGGGPAEIGALVRRIEAFRRARSDNAPPPPARFSTDSQAVAAGRAITSFEFEADASGMISWASPGIAPMVVGITLGDPEPDAIASVDPVSARNMELRLPVRGGRISFSATPAITGLWLIDASPRFAPLNRAFEGYAGRIRRQADKPEAEAGTEPVDEGSDRMRQVLHELRTPVNAIQGFAEIIQQQLFGPAPNEYRALAASVAVDAARLLAGFDEIERLAKLESRAMTLPAGSSDMRAAVHIILQRLENVLRPRNARISFDVSGGPFVIGIEQTDAQQLVWRVLATLAGSMAPGEEAKLTIHGDGTSLDISAEIPLAMRETADLFDTSGQHRAGSISTGAFGTGFTLRLARAEALAVGGGLRREQDRLVLTLPVLTEAMPDNSDDTFGAHQSART